METTKVTERTDFWADTPRVVETPVTAPVVDRPQYTWRDFELDDQPARAEPHHPDSPDYRDAPPQLRRRWSRSSTGSGTRWTAHRPPTSSARSTAWPGCPTG